VTIFVKHVAICLMLIAKLMEVDTKLMKIVLYCTKFKLNEAIDKTKAKVDTKLME
jgi:hypothetical protein